MVYAPHKTVIVEVMGGVVQDTTAPDGIRVVVVDYDNHPDAEINTTKNGRTAVKLNKKRTRA